MKFPIIADIASTSVVSIDINSSVSDTINIMLKHEHRNVIVLDNECFKIFTVIDIYLRGTGGCVLHLVPRAKARG